MTTRHSNEPYDTISTSARLHPHSLLALLIVNVGGPLSDDHFPPCFSIVVPMRMSSIMRGLLLPISLQATDHLQMPQQNPLASTSVFLYF